MSSDSPQSPLDSSILSTSSDVGNSKADPSSKTLKVSKKHKKSSRSSSGIAESDGQGLGIRQSGSSSSLDSRSSQTPSPLPTLDECDTFDSSMVRRGSGPTPVSPKVKSLHASTQPGSEKVTIIKKNSKSPRGGSEELKPPTSKTTITTPKLALSTEEVSRSQDEDLPESPSSDDSVPISKKKKAPRPPIEVVKESPHSSSSSETSTPKSSRNKPSRKHLAESAPEGVLDKKRIEKHDKTTSNPLSSSSLLPTFLLSPPVKKTLPPKYKEGQLLTLNLPPPPSPSPASSECSSPVTETAKHGVAALLIDVLRSPHHMALLKSHMVKERCDENLDFWLDVQRLWHSFQLQMNDSKTILDAAAILEQGASVYNTYLEAMAPKALNLPAKVASRLRHAFKAPNPNFPITASLFSEAQAVAFRVMECDPFPRFLNNAGSSATHHLIQLGSSTHVLSYVDAFSETLQEALGRLKSKWSKVSDENGIRVSKLEHHGVNHLRAQATYYSFASPLQIANYMANTANWHHWFIPGCKCIELEKISNSLSVVFLSWKTAATSKSDTPRPDRYTILYVTTKHEETHSTILFSSIPHSTAPTPQSATRCSFINSGFKIESGGLSTDPISINFMISAEKSEFKKWDSDSSVFADALLNLQNHLQ